MLILKCSGTTNYKTKFILKMFIAQNHSTSHLGNNIIITVIIGIRYLGTYYVHNVTNRLLKHNLKDFLYQRIKLKFLVGI